MFFHFRCISNVAVTLGNPLVEVLQTLFCHVHIIFCPVSLSQVKIIIYIYFLAQFPAPYAHRVC